jgi:hypothetical protein
MKDELLQALNEAIDALGDIPAEQSTDEQKAAYKLCIKVRDKNQAEEK